jgi:hypothetical protein
MFVSVDTPSAPLRSTHSPVARANPTTDLRMDEWVPVTLFCTDLTPNEVFNAAARSCCHCYPPVRAYVGIGTLPLEARFGVPGVAVQPPRLQP